MKRTNAGRQRDIFHISFMVLLNVKRFEKNKTPAGIGLSSDSRVGEANSIGGHPYNNHRWKKIENEGEGGGANATPPGCRWEKTPPSGTGT